MDEQYWIIDGAQILNSMLLKELPAKRINGLLNLWLSLRATKTDEEIQNALVSKNKGKWERNCSGIATKD